MGIISGLCSVHPQNKNSPEINWGKKMADVWFENEYSNIPLPYDVENHGRCGRGRDQNDLPPIEASLYQIQAHRRHYSVKWESRT